MKTIRVFDVQGDPDNVSNPAPWDCDAFAHLEEFNHVGNDSYHEWTVCDELSGGGYVTEEEQAALNKWLIKAGAKSGEEVLIFISW